MIRKILSPLLILIFFVAGAVAYTWPAAEAILDQRTDLFMSDGTDLTTNPYHFDVIHRTYLETPSLFFYGGLPNPQLNAPEGFVAWYSGIEKLAGLVIPFFSVPEQAAAIFALALMVLNGLCFYGMSRSFGWNRWLSLALATAWAFSPFTRARAQVHASLVGIYALPLAFWALNVLQNSISWRSIGLTSIMLLFCSFSPHYYLIFLAWFSPFFLVYFFLDSRIRKQWKKTIPALILTALPSILLVGFGVLKPAPAKFTARVANVLPVTGKSPVWPHPFLDVFAARPRDFVTGDVAIGKTDLNPLRGLTNEWTFSDRTLGNYHEHANGIRWIIWVAFFAALALWLKSRRQWGFEQATHRQTILFLSLGLYGFLNSISPDWGFMWGPSAWLYSLVEQIRVPNRMGMYFHFSILMVIGLSFHQWLPKATRWRAAAWAIPLLVLLDFPPFMNPMPMDRIASSIAPLTDGKVCGLGMRFPHVSEQHNTLAFYQLVQKLRGTRCQILSPSVPNPRDFAMTELFGYTEPVLSQLRANDSGLRQKLVSFARCNQLDWVLFDPGTPQTFVQDFCREWGGQMKSADFCRNPAPAVEVPLGRPDVCLVQIR